MNQETTKSSSAHDNVSEKLRFKSSVVFDGKTDDGTRFSDEVYEVSDCTKIYRKLMLFRTRPSANKELSSQIQRAASVADRSPEFDRDHHQIGERALLTFTPDGKNEGYSILIWTENSEFHSIRGTSSHHVLEFEKWLRDPNKSKDSPENVGNQEMTFDLLRAFDGKTNEGIKFSEKQFKSTECITISARTEYYESPSVAQDEFQKRLKDAANVLEREPTQEATGQNREERVVAMFAPDPSYEYQPQAVVIWTNGRELHSIKAPSLRHVREFEKRNQQK